MGNRKSCGFTLAELMITLSIAAILLAGAIPAFSNLVQRHRLQGVQQEFLAVLAFTKQQAIMRGRDVALCPSRDHRTCLADGLWHEGWIVFVDGDENREPDTAADIIQVHGALPSAITLKSSKFRRVIAFQPIGTAGGSNATFTFCGDGASTMVLSRLGRIRWTEAPRGDPACPAVP